MSLATKVDAITGGQLKTFKNKLLVPLGGNVFYILKISAVDPTPIRAIGAAQAGISLDAFLDTRLGKVTNG